MKDSIFYEQLEAWHRDGEYQMIIGVIEALPEGELDYRLISSLARAYNNLAVLGTDGTQIDRDMLERSVSLLYSVAEDGKNDSVWNYRLGYSLYYLDREEEALYYFKRSCELDPDDADTADFIALCRDRLSEREASPELYDEDELAAVEEHIKEHFGDYPNVLHEIYSPDIHLDICVIPPNEEHNCYTLVTLGMGAHRMNVPEELSGEPLERAELMISLPPDWDMDACVSGSDGEKWHWPVRLLKSTARIPIAGDTWLGWGHTVSNSADNREPYAENVRFSGAILVTPGAYGRDAAACRLPNGEEVNFYQLTPLYPEEIEYKLKNDADSLLDLLTDGMLTVTDTERPPVVDRDGGEIGYGLIVDDAGAHLESIRKKRLPVDDLSAYNHMAVYLRFCIEHDLMSDVFLDACPDIESAVLDGTSRFDLRLFLRDDERCGGVLTLPYFNCDGVDFAKWYYLSDDEAHSYASDIDSYAEAYFGAERCRSDEFRGEPYLFLPWSEAYYRAMEPVIEKRFEAWLSETEEPEGEPYISRDELRELLTDFTGPRGCLATDRVIIDGEPVGVLCRERPEPADRGWDSGWRFMTEDEYDEYAAGNDSDVEDRLAVYDLNTLCNYDTGIIDLLDAPYGAYFERGDDGAFYRFDE